MENRLARIGQLIFFAFLLDQTAMRTFWDSGYQEEMSQNPQRPESNLS